MSTINLPPGVKTSHIGPVAPPPRCLSFTDLMNESDKVAEQIVDSYLDDGDAKTHLIELLLAMEDRGQARADAEMMAVCGLKQDMRDFIENRGFYVNG